MKIIADTNIWYYLGRDKTLFEKVKEENIVPSFVNIYELSKSENIIDNEELSRGAIQKLFHFREHVIYEPPFIHIAKLNCEFDFDPMRDIREFLEFTSKFAKGHTIEKGKEDEFRVWLSEKRNSLQTAADFFNEKAEEIRQNIIDKKEHKKKETYSGTAAFINFCFETTTEKKCNLDGFDFNRIELLVRTLDHYFKTLETSTMKIQPNDWFDFAIMAYVQLDDKFWTCDKRWVRLAKEAGCENYLYGDEK